MKTQVTVETARKELNEIAKELGLKFVGVKTATLVEQINATQVEVEQAAEVEVVETQPVVESTLQKVSSYIEAHKTEHFASATQVPEICIESLLEQYQQAQTALTAALERQEELELELESRQGGRKAGGNKHENNPMCQELIALMAQVTPDLSVVRNNKSYPLVTESEQRLWNCFVESGYNIKKTGEIYGCSHTNVWQRLYGPDNATGLRGKLMNYFNASEVEEA